MTGPVRPLAVWRIELLGGLRAVSGGTVLTRFGSRKIAALLARLALQPHRLHSREELIDLLWPEAELAVGRNRLRHALSTLRQLLRLAGGGDVLIIDRSGVRLNPRNVGCDALEFEHLARAGRRAQALQLYRGELLPGFYEDWVQDERLRLAALYERLAADATVRAAPPTDRPADFAPAAAPLPAFPGIGVTLFPDRQLLLPSYLSSFIGRQQERQQLAELLASARLVTVSGPGGCGKTRLAVELARDLAGRFETVLFVALGEASRPELIAEAVRLLLRLPAAARDAEDQVVEFLSERDALLVLDNYEQLLPAGAAVVERLLAALPKLRCLATSRRLLAIDGEREFALSPLPLPDAEATLADLAANPSIALLIDRARSTRPGFRLNARNAADLAVVARALEGLPLAIELAASRIRRKSIAAMAQEIGLSRDWIARAMPQAAREARHVSLQAAIGWSWKLLDAGQQRFLRALTTLRGNWTAPAATAVTGVANAGSRLESLVAHSLLQVQTDAWGGMRYSMLEMIREFAAGQGDPAELGPVRERHRRHYLAEVRRNGSVDAPRLALDQDNVEQALASAMQDGAVDAALDLAVALRPYADTHGLGPRLIELVEIAAAKAAPGDDRASRAHMLLAEALTIACRLDDAVAQARRAVELAGTELLRAEADYVLARACWDRDRSAAQFRPSLEAALALARGVGASRLQARVLLLLGNSARQDRRDPELAQAFYGQAVEVAQDAGLARLAVQGRFNLGLIARRHRRFDLAVRYSDELIRDCRRRGDAIMLADALHERGLILTEMRLWKEAVAAQRECIAHGWRHRTLITLAYALWNLARPLARAGDAASAARLAGFSAAYWERQGGPLSADDRRYLRRVRGIAAARIGAERADAAFAEGPGLGIADAVAMILGRPGQQASGRVLTMA